MQYTGGKSRIAKDIRRFILDSTPKRERCLEPFMGGGGMTAELAPYFKEYVASDYHDELILMWKALQAGWEPPDSLSEERYNELKNATTASPERTFAGYACSWGGSWFGTYARAGEKVEAANGGPVNYAARGRSSLLNLRQASKHVTFECRSYNLWQPDEGWVVYCDPPYAGTMGYKAAGEFDHDKFWSVMDEWVDRGATVFVSEYSAPEHWIKAKTITHLRTINANNMESVEDHVFMRPEQYRPLPSIFD